MTYTVLLDKEVKAKKQHTCDCCGNIIEKGEIYNYNKTIYNSEVFGTTKLCVSCKKLISENPDYFYPASNNEEYYDEDELRELYKEFIKYKNTIK